MKALRIHFQVPGIVLEHADTPYLPIATCDLPVSTALRLQLDELSRAHAAAIARGVAASDGERTEFTRRYQRIFSALALELGDYGEVVDEVFPDVFEPWFDAESLPGKAARNIRAWMKRILSCFAVVPALRRRDSESIA